MIKKRIYLATGNAHKFEEFATLLDPVRAMMELLPAEATGGMPEVEETGLTFEENALLKASALQKRVPEGTWVLADDSGLEVDALDGGPGVRSARYAGPGAGAPENNARLLQELSTVDEEDRGARFVCLLVLLDPGGNYRTFAGSCEGTILRYSAGGHGFGYDPLFCPAGYSMSFAELGETVKHRMSHRSRAVKQLLHHLSGPGFRG
jgi:XTP/dITP diphosphohydrolase